jgi:hypothetical protein
MCRRQNSQGVFGKRTRLVETSFRVLRPVQRYWNYQQLDGSYAGKLRNRRGQYAAELASRGMQPIVLQSVNGFLEASLVRPERHRALKRRWRETASPAQSGI